ncbi:MAG: ATP-binding protein, partial [Aestuariivirgaceae bacterium]
SNQQGLDPDEYRASQLSAVKRTTPHMMIANIMAAVLVLWVAWPTPVQWVVVIWAAVISSVSGFILISGWYRSANKKPAKKSRRTASPQAGRRAEVYALALGGIWGALPAATFTIAPPNVSFIIMGVVMGACGLGAFNLSRFPSAALIYASVVTSSLTGAAFAVGDRGGVAAAFLGAIYGIALGGMILKTHYRALQRAGAQKALENQNEIIKLLLRDFESGTKDWLWETDAEGRLQYASERLAQLMDRPLKDVLGEPLLETVCGGQSVDCWADIATRMADRKAIELIEVPLVNQGNISWWQINAEPILRDQQHFEGYRGVAIDITDTRRAADEMLKAKQAAERASAAKSQFLAVISHELRTPLNSILGYAELASADRREPVAKADMDEYLNNILEHSRHLNQLINNVLDFTRIENGRMKLVEQQVDVDELVEIIVRMCQLQAREAGVELCENYKIRGMVLQGDLTRLKQVLINIISNAIKFTPANGKVEVTVGQSVEGEPEITVTDTGIGIEAAKIEAIFEPFVQAEETKTRQYEGAGLGLAISRQLARLHDGDVTLTSEPGKGTVARLTLPKSRLIDTEASEAAA